MSRDVTLCLAYYENPVMLARQVVTISQMPEQLLEHLQVIVVDDGSPEHPAQLYPGIRLFRVAVDVRWNQDACRNIAVHEARTPWVILTDMDHLVTAPLLRTAIFGDLDPSNAYTFRRVSEPHLEPYKPHPNSYLMTKELYDAAGGYDERFAGLYGTDGMFKNRVTVAANAVIEIKDALVRVPRDVTPDASTTRYERKTPEDDAGRARVRKLIMKSGDHRPQRLMFEYHEVTA